jgi:hypothetical protein
MVQQLDFNADGRYAYNSLFIMKDHWMNIQYGYNHSFVLYKEYGNYVLHFSAVRVQRSLEGCSVAQ